MNQYEAKVFEERYWHTAKFNNSFHLIYAAMCGGCLLSGVLQFQKLWIMVVLALVCYPVMHVKLFSKGTPQYLLKKIRDTNQEVIGEVESIQGIFGLHQVNYSYLVDGKKLMGFDTVPRSSVRTLHKGDQIIVHYSQSNSKLSMIKFGEQGVAPNP